MSTGAVSLGPPLDLLLVRHGESEANAAAGMLASGDPTGRNALLKHRRHDSAARLTKLGREQAHSVGRWISDNAGRFDKFLVSPYVRAMETAAEMGLADAQWEVDSMLAEREQGVSQGNGSPMVELSESESTRYEMSNFFWAPAAGESCASVCTRIQHVLNSLAVRAGGKRVIIVCHMRVINAFQVLLENKTLSECEDVVRRDMPNGTVVWYTSQDPEGAVHDRMLGGKIVKVQPGGLSARIEPFSITKQYFTNEELLAQVHRWPQVIGSL